MRTAPRVRAAFDDAERRRTGTPVDMDAEGWFKQRSLDTIGHYVQVSSAAVYDDQVPDAALRMYLMLRILAGREYVVVASFVELAALAGCEVKKISRLKDDLQAAGLVITRSAGRHGTVWTLLPPEPSHLADVFCDVRRRLDQLDITVRSGVSAPTGGGAAAPTPGSPSASTLKKEDIKRTRTERTRNENVLHRPTAGGAVDKLEMLTLAAALSTRMNDLAQVAAGVNGTEAGRRYKPTHPTDLLPWLEVDVPAERILAGWAEWLAHLFEEGSPRAEDVELRIRGATREARPLFSVFADWLLAGQELADPGSQAAPIEEQLDLKAAARVARRALRRPSSRHTPLAVDSVSVRASRIESGASLLALGTLLRLRHVEASTKRWPVPLSASDPMRNTVEVFVRLASDGGSEPLWQHIVAADELLELGAFTASTEQPRAVARSEGDRCNWEYEGSELTSGFHAAKCQLSVRTGRQPTCELCGIDLELRCMEPKGTQPAFLLDGALLCADCVERALVTTWDEVAKDCH